MTDRFEKFSLSMFKITRYWNKIATEEMKEYGLKGPYAFYLATILRLDGQITGAKLCEMCAKDKADVSRALNTMEEKGLIERMGKNYRSKIKLTEAGSAAALSVKEKVMGIVGFVGKDLDETNRENFYLALENISNNLETLFKAGEIA